MKRDFVIRLALVLLVLPALLAPVGPAVARVAGARRIEKEQSASASRVIEFLFMRNVSRLFVSGKLQES